MNKIVLLLPDSFNTCIRAAAGVADDEEVDDVARRSFITGIVCMWLVSQGWGRAATEMMVLNGQTIHH